jgi:hypothetical protein
MPDQFETPDINLATFIKSVKGINTAGHFFKGDQLVIQFPVPKEKGAQYKEEYLNSPFAMYDATKRNFLQLLKR